MQRLIKHPTHFSPINSKYDFKSRAQANSSLLEKTHTPGLQNLSSRHFFHYSIFFIFSFFFFHYYYINPKKVYKLDTNIAVLRNWEQFQICSFSVLYTLYIYIQLRRNCRMQAFFERQRIVL